MTARILGEHGAVRSSPLREQLVVLLRDLRASLAARVEVAEVELRASAHELTSGAVALASGVMFALGAWVTGCALGAVALNRLGLSWLASLLIVAVANGVLAALALTSARKHLRRVGLKHTYHAFLGVPHRDDRYPLPSAGDIMPRTTTTHATSTLRGIHDGAT